MIIAEQAVRTAEPLRDFHRTGTARCVLAEVLVRQGRLDAAETVMAELDRLFAGADDPWFIPGWERTKALIALARGRPDAAVKWCRREAHWPAEAGERQLTPDTRAVLVTALRESGDEAAASALLDALSSSPFARDMPRIRALALDERARLIRDEDPDSALSLYHSARRIRSERHMVLGCITSLESLAALSWRRGAAEAAGVLAGAAERARADAGAGPPALDEELQALLDEPAAGVIRGRAMALSDVMAYASRARGPRRRPASGWASLTPTEISVVDLAVQGLTNPQIADRLFMSRGTVKTHLAHVYAKLDVANRTELTRKAAQRR